VADRVSVSLESCEAALKPVLGKLFDLYLVTLLEKNLSFFVISGLLQPADIGRVKRRGAELCAELGPQVRYLFYVFHEGLGSGLVEN
jgi:hypothetical protein